jgi:Kef-type K+ transport system membrane component KefB
LARVTGAGLFYVRSPWIMTQYPHLALYIYAGKRKRMPTLDAYTTILLICSLVVLSYLFSVLNRLTRIPSVLLLLTAGVVLRYITDIWGLTIAFPPMLIEVLGTVGLIMIVLEAGLDLEISADRLPLIRNSLVSALVIFVMSSLSVATILYYWIEAAPFMHCLVYAIPLSIVSSAIVLPSVHHLGDEKREFLIYEASFSDVLGIMVFNFITAGEVINAQSVGWFFGSIVVALLLSVGVCLLLIWMLVRNRVNVRFFLLFAILIMVYIGGKLMRLPSLITILIFGLVVNNWGLFRWRFLHARFPEEHVRHVADYLKSITAESSFLIRTFFFVIFGFSMNLHLLNNPDVLKLGAAIVLALLALRFIYLQVLHEYSLLPELLYIPRGLITVLLFYKIPEWQRIDGFDEGVLFFVILATSILTMIGAIVYKDRPMEVKKADDI